MAESTSSTNRIAALNVLNVIAYIANVGFVNGVPALFNVPDNGELSRKYQTIVTPAGWAFAIWGLIFLVQAIWSVVQVAVPSYRTNPLVVEGVDYNYIWVCLFQIAWTFAFGFERIGLSLVFMLGILFFLIRIYSLQQKTLIENNDVAFSRNYWLLRFPFGIHLGWIIAATLVNTNVVLVAFGVSARLQFYAAMLSLVITLVVTAGSLFNQADKKHPDVVIPLVLVWALVSHKNQPFDHGNFLVCGL